MNALEKNRWICFGKEATYAKDSRIAALQKDFANHFKDSIDYQPEAKVNGKQQELIVAKNKSVTNTRRIYAYPGETFYAGDVVDALNAKWLITEVDQNKEVCSSVTASLSGRIAIPAKSFAVGLRPKSRITPIWMSQNRSQFPVVSTRFRLRSTKRPLLST